MPNRPSCFLTSAIRAIAAREMGAMTPELEPFCPLSTPHEDILRITQETLAKVEAQSYAERCMQLARELRELREEGIRTYGAFDDFDHLDEAQAALERIVCDVEDEGSGDTARTELVPAPRPTTARGVTGLHLLQRHEEDGRFASDGEAQDWVLACMNALDGIPASMLQQLNSDHDRVRTRIWVETAAETAAAMRKR